MDQLHRTAAHSYQSALGCNHASKVCFVQPAAEKWPRRAACDVCCGNPKSLQLQLHAHVCACVVPPVHVCVCCLVYGRRPAVPNEAHTSARGLVCGSAWAVPFHNCFCHQPLCQQLYCSTQNMTGSPEIHTSHSFCQHCSLAHSCLSESTCGLVLTVHSICCA